MAITTYAGLQSAIISHAFRTGDVDFAAAVPDFIIGAEQMFNYGTQSLDALRVAEMEGVSNSILDGGEISLPTDYLQWRRVKVAGHVLEPAEPNWVSEHYDGAAVGGVSRYFTVTSDTLTVFPSSDADIELTYFAKIPALSDANPTNWLLTKAPMAYLYGALLHAAPFGMDDARIQTYGTLLQQSIAGLIRSDNMGRYARTVTRVRGPTP